MRQYEPTSGNKSKIKLPNFLRSSILKGGVAMHFFCPNCFRELKNKTDTCPYCGFNIGDYQRTVPYENRLIHALNHPVREVRMGAIISLGNMKSEKAVKPLIEHSMENPKDVVEGMEILNAIRKILKGEEFRKTLLYVIKSHPSKVIARMAADMLSDSYGKIS